MVSEDKIKLMTKIAIYESGEGRKDLSIVHFHIHQYIKLETIQAFIINTIAFIMVLCFAMLIFLDTVLQVIEHHRYGRYLFVILLLYIIFITVQVLYARMRAIEQYEESLPRIREYKKYLTKLYYMYELEEKPEEMKQEELEEKLEEEMNAETMDF
ncbi:MAG TPA: hypothetical protein IAC33_08625 [Candidatus Fimousia stercorigallinarum]|nr:hypothetical protein [Candidatus Fimousia stercorigallinarum]